MRIGMNAAFLRRHATGTGQYTSHLLSALQRADPAIQVIPYLPGVAAHRSHRETEEEDTGELANWEKLWFEQVSFPRACRSDRVDVAHVPYFAPPMWSATPVVVTIHDLIPLILPAYRGSVWVRGYTHLVSWAARRADWIVTDSLCSQQDIVQHLRVDPRHVMVTYLAVDPTCRRVDDLAQLESMRQNYRLPEDYILYLGGFDQRKNVQGLLQAFAQLRRHLGETGPSLVIAGSLPDHDSAFSPDPRRMARDLGLGNEVVFPGWIAEQDKPALYSGARFFVFLSLYEGFGLMALEAMACGVPVVASDRSSLPEVVGSGGVLVNPEDPTEIAECMVRLLRQPGLRDQLAEKARLQAARFDWARTAAQTLEVYELARTRRGQP